MVIRYCPISPYGYPLLSDITLWLSVIVRYHPMIIRCCPIIGPLLPITLWLSLIVRYHPMVIIRYIVRYCPLSPYVYPLLSAITQ